MSTSHLGPVLILCQDPFPCMDTVLCQGAGGGAAPLCTVPQASTRSLLKPRYRRVN